mgnify:CR=1 FL=1
MTDSNGSSIVYLQPNGIIMLLIKKELVKTWLKTIGRNQSWLANRMGLHKSTMSQYLNNNDKLSAYFISAILDVTNMKYEDLFFSDSKPDTRERYGDVFVVAGKPMRLPAYKEHLSRTEQEEVEEIKAWQELTVGVSFENQDQKRRRDNEQTPEKIEAHGAPKPHPAG